MDLVARVRVRLPEWCVRLKLYEDSAKAHIEGRKRGPLCLRTARPAEPSISCIDNRCRADVKSRRHLPAGWITGDPGVFVSRVVCSRFAGGGGVRRMIARLMRLCYSI